LAYREARSLYKDKCDKCGEEVISIFPENALVTAYCTSCWWGDGWDPLDFGVEYDFSKSFFEQFYKLQKTVPREATGSKNCENCLYSNGDVRCKDCTLTFDCVESINCYNSQVVFKGKDCVDLDNAMNTDHSYDALNSNNLYNSKFIYLSDDCIDCSFLYNCVGCSNCFGCVNLRNKKYYIWNKPYSKEEYEKEIKNLNLGSYKKLLEAKQKFLALHKETPKRFALIRNSLNVSGEDIQQAKNCQNCFFTRYGVENCRNIFAAGYLLKDGYDAIFGGDQSELFYETVGGMQSQRCFFTRAPYHSKDIEYCNRIINCSNLFGCVNLRNKQYCIFNKQYTKEEYFELREKIIKQMNEVPYIDRKGREYRYGEFFPIETSLWGYNETWAHKYFPLTKDEVIEKGYNWQDDYKRDYQPTIKACDLPDNINDVSESILNEVIECEHSDKNCNQQCTRAFKILNNEFNIYKQINIALPRLCPICRHYERLKFLYPLKLWHRKCMKEGCNNEFETSYSPDREDIIYCEKCYQAEFI
jgi:hypothetical protein